MTDLPLVASRSNAGAFPRPLSRLATLYASVGAAVALGAAAALAAAPPAEGLEWQLVLLLRFMAVVKAAMALGAIGLTHWRLRAPISDRLAGGFVAALAAMLVAPGLIWSLQHVAAGAAFFHAGLLAFLALAWKDDAAGRLLGSRRAQRPRT